LVYRNIISIRTTNFGWACPNRVFSQAVFQKFAAGHPKFGVQREVRASPWGLALTACTHTLTKLCAPTPGAAVSWTVSRLNAPRVPKKAFFQKTKKLGAGWRHGFRWYERPGERHERTQAVALKEWWAGLHSAERESELTAAADKRACPISSIRNLSWPSQWRFQIFS
jgi:hypothetical protein